MNLYKTLPIEGAFKEALFELGATDRRTNAVTTTELAAFLVSKGFPKKGGRTYQGDEHIREVAIDLASMARIRPHKGWHHFVGGHASDPWNNWEWCVAPDALREREVEPAPDKTKPVPPPPPPKTIPEMDRQELIDYIEKHGGVGKTFPPTKTDRLREIARDLELTRGKPSAPEPVVAALQQEPAPEAEPVPVIRSAAEILASLPKVHMS